MSTYLQPTLRVIFLTISFSLNLPAQSPENIDIGRLEENVRLIRQQCIALRESSQLTVKTYETTKFLNTGGSRDTIQTNEDVKALFLKDQWVIERVKLGGKVVHPQLQVRNKTFVFQLSQTGKVFSLRNSKRLGSQTGPYATPADRELLWFLDASANVTPVVSLIDILDSEKCQLIRQATDSNGNLLEFATPKGVLPGIVEDSTFRVTLDSMNRVRKSEMRFAKQDEQYLFSYDVDYDESSPQPLVPKSITFRRLKVGSPGFDEFKAEDLSYSEIEFDEQLLRPEHYGIPQSALEAMNPSEPFSNRFWGLMFLSALFLISAWWIFVRKKSAIHTSAQ